MEGFGSPPAQAGSGQSSQSSPAISGGGSLEELGLVDPSTGRALSTPDWAPSRQAPPSSPERDPASPEYRQDRFPADQAQSEQTGASGWDSDDNPYKAEALRSRQSQPDPAQQARQGFQTRVQSIDTQAQAAFTQLVATGMPAEQAQVVVGAARAAAISDAQLQADRLALLPVAKREVSERIAREFSLPNAKIEPGDLAGETTVEGMRARAKTLAEARRGSAFSQRRANGSDRVERSAGPGTKIDYESLAPFDMIRLGIARGQFN